jgi:hypothetical protein
MLDVHPLHEPPHTWKGFFVHIATIVVGLVIAVALEQTILFFHHRHQIQELEEQMRAVFTSDLASSAENSRQLVRLRAYLTELRAAIVARLQSQSDISSPPVDDSRMATSLRVPSMAPLDAARQNGTIALLSTERMRIYNRIALQRDFQQTALDAWLMSVDAFSAFHERFVDSEGGPGFGRVAVGPQLRTLSQTDLTEYLNVVATLAKKTDSLILRNRVFELECRVVLNGARNEEELTRAVAEQLSLPGSGRDR